MNRGQRLYLTFSGLFLATIVGIVIFGVFAYFSIDAMQENIKGISYKTQKLKIKKDQLETLELKYSQIEDYVRLANEALPAKKEASRLLTDIDSLASESGLNFTVLKINGTTKNTANPNLLQTTSGKYGYEMPIEINVVGPYSGFVGFLNKLQNYQRLNNITSVDIARTKENSSVPDQINVKIKMVVYLSK